MPRSKSKKKPSKNNKAAAKSKSKAKSSDSYDSNDSECCDDDDDEDEEDAADINNDNESDEGEEETEATTTSYSSSSKKKEDSGRKFQGNGGYCCYDSNYNDNDNDNCNCVCDSENAGTSNQSEYYRPCLDLPASCCQNRVNFKLPCGFSAGCKNYQNNQNNQRNSNCAGNENDNAGNNPAGKIPPCYPTCCQPKAYWEREIVKFNPGGKWNPQIEEKGETGRPDLFPDKNRNKRSKDRDRKGRKRKGCGKDKSEMDDEDQPVALGEPCNAYRCYKDPCLPSGLAYCTPKHPRRSSIPPCPEKFPIKPRRIAICPEDQEPLPGQREAAVASGLPPGVAEALGPAFLQGYGLSSNCRENQRNANRARNINVNNFQGQGQGRGQDQGQDECCPQQNAPPIYNDFPTNQTANGKKRKIPDEWIQVLPLCDPCKPPKNKKKKGGKSKSKSGDSSTCCSYDDE